MSRSVLIAVLSAAGGCLLSAAALLPAGAAAQKAPEVALPGVDLSALSPAQVEVVRRVAQDEFCHCGCPHTLAGCLREHASCKHAPRMAALVARLAGQGMTAREILKALTEYYSGFDRRKRVTLDVKSFSPPLGKPDAPVSMVEFSDFACPYCQAVRPELERFVLENESRLNLYYKPFPITSHPRSHEAAVAGEWARDRGLFWKMHDQLFDHPHALSDDDLASYAERIGADAHDLRSALEQGRNKQRIAASQAEARGAGLVGTPTLYVNGRRLTLPSAPSELRETLRFTLEDEEEWSKHNGWVRD
jgi:protein-disulfide isomerase